MKKVIIIFYFSGEVILFSLMVLGFIVGSESDRFFLLLGVIGVVYSMLYFLLKEVI